MDKEPGIIEIAFNLELGSKLKAKRRQLKMSQQSLAAEVGVHRNTLCRWEYGLMSCPLWMLLRLADVLGCNMVLFLPAQTFTWGEDLGPMQRERDRHMRRAVQAERDPPLTRDEILGRRAGGAR